MTSPLTPLDLNRPSTYGHLLQMEKEIGKMYLERGNRSLEKFCKTNNQ